MTRNPVVTWFGPRRCWKKKYRGKVYYFATGGACKSKSDQEGYEAAVREWEALKEQLDAQDAQDAPPEPSETAVQAIRGPATQIPTPPVNGLPAPSEEDKNVVEWLHDVAEKTGLSFGPMFRAMFQHVETGAGFSQPSIVPTSEKTSLPESIRRYLDMRHTEFVSGQVSAETYQEHRKYLHVFQGIAATHGVESSEQINEEFLDHFRTGQFRQVGSNTISPTTCRKRLYFAKRFIEWCYENRLLPELPRNLAHFARIRLPKPDPEFYTVDECRKLFEAANPRLKMCIALGLNCGYTQVDVATLEHGMVDWKRGIINRNRNMTEIPQRHKLWPETMKWIRSEMTDPQEGGLMFRTRQGGPLVNLDVRTDGSTAKSDSVRLAFSKLKKEVGFDKKDKRTFKNFRKSAANEIAQHYQDRPHVVDLFLAHAERGMKRHYVDQHFDLLDEATDYLDGLHRLGRP